MPSAALGGFYSNINRKGGSRNITYHNLHNTDIKKLVSILRDYPTDSNSSSYWHEVKKASSDLPRHLRSSSLPSFLTSEDKDERDKTGTLCAEHKGLNHGLIHSIWSSLRYELDKGVGGFLYPVIMKAGLPAHQEVKIRQLEPVLEMWQKDFDIVDHTPEGREAIYPIMYADNCLVSKWHFQENECPACMLARIGSDDKVLFALLASLIGKFSDRNVGKKDQIKSVRIRWMRYWLKQFEDGEEMVNEAWELGEEMKRVRKAYKAHRGCEKKGFYRRAGRAGTASSHHPTNRESNVGIDISGEFHPGFQGARTDVRPKSAATISDFGMDITEPWSPFNNNNNYAQRPHSVYSQIRERIIQNPSPHQPQHFPPPKNQTRSQQASVHSVSELDSDYPSTPSLVPAPLRPSPQYSSPLSPRLDGFLNLPDVPNPPSQSMYASYGTSTYDQSLYSGYDASPPASPATGPSNTAGHLYDSKERNKKRGTVGTKWSELY